MNLKYILQLHIKIKGKLFRVLQHRSQAKKVNEVWVFLISQSREANP